MPKETTRDARWAQSQRSHCKSPLLNFGTIVFFREIPISTKPGSNPGRRHKRLTGPVRIGVSEEKRGTRVCHMVSSSCETPIQRWVSDEPARMTLAQHSISDGEFFNCLIAKLFN